jgi:hypothetical protein
LLCLAFYNRLAAIVSRLRGFQRERLAELERISELSDDTGRHSQSRIAVRRRVLEGLEVQTGRVLARARLIRCTLVCLLVTVALMVLASILHGLSIVWPAATVPAAVLFLAGMLSLLSGTVAAVVELTKALDVVEFESHFTTDLTLEYDALAAEEGARASLMPPRQERWLTMQAEVPPGRSGPEGRVSG